MSQKNPGSAPLRLPSARGLLHHPIGAVPAGHCAGGGAAGPLPGRLSAALARAALQARLLASRWYW